VAGFFKSQCIIDGHVRECDERPYSADPSSRVAAATADRDPRLLRSYVMMRDRIGKQSTERSNRALYGSQSLSLPVVVHQLDQTLFTAQ